MLRINQFSHLYIHTYNSKIYLYSKTVHYVTHNINAFSYLHTYIHTYIQDLLSSLFPEMAAFYADKRTAVGTNADLTAVEKVTTIPYIHTYILIHTYIHPNTYIRT